MTTPDGTLRLRATLEPRGPAAAIALDTAPREVELPPALNALQS